jgi:hypothetical protein
MDYKRELNLDSLKFIIRIYNIKIIELMELFANQCWQYKYLYMWLNVLVFQIMKEGNANLLTSTRRNLVKIYAHTAIKVEKLSKLSHVNAQSKVATMDIVHILA